jgi:hypothetical protein
MTFSELGIKGAPMECRTPAHRQDSNTSKLPTRVVTILARFAKFEMDTY